MRLTCPINATLLIIMTLFFIGPREQVLPYFASIGYECPATVDIADFLQVLPTPDGKLYMKAHEPLTYKEALVADGTTSDVAPTADVAKAPHTDAPPLVSPRGTTALVAAWKVYSI